MPGLYPTAYRATFPAFFMRLALVCFYCLSVFVYVLHFIATMSFAGCFLSVLFCLLSMLISDSRFDLVWFRLSCDHGLIRSGSVNVRKQQLYTLFTVPKVFPYALLRFGLLGGTVASFFLFFRFAPFWRKNREVYPFLAKPIY